MSKRMNLKIKTLFIILIMIIAVLPPPQTKQTILDVQANASPTIHIGTYIQFGTYNSAPILWRVIYKDGSGNPVLLADRILTIKAFDAEGTYHTGNNDRVSSGSNYYPGSNIRQWLNSSSSNSGGNIIDWTQNSNSTEKGFFADGNFTSIEDCSGCTSRSSWK